MGTPDPNELDRRTFLTLAAAGALAGGTRPANADTNAMTETTTPSYALTRPAHVGAAHLTVADLPQVSAFYQSMLGMTVLDKSMSGHILGAGRTPLLTLTTRGDARPAPRTAAGLFHNAFLMPGRTELARWLRHAAHNNVALDGASDHLVSEAIYLSDPEGNGIEIYADRNPQDWTFHDDGTVEMATNRLDLQALYDSAPATPWEGMAEGSAIGHIHLQVGNIPEANAFYRDVLGLKVMATYPGASFFATGGYHHHVAANIWNSRGAMARAPAMTGLSDYTLRFNDEAALKATLASLEAHGIEAAGENGVWSLQDPWGIGLKLTA